MKKLLLTIIAIITMASSISAQNVARKCVLVEAFTSIWCSACPAAAAGIAEMVKQDLSIAPLAFHCEFKNPSDYVTTETNARGMSYYKVKGFPTVIVDGVSAPTGIGGNATMWENSYNLIKAEYDKRINVESPYEIELTYEYDSWNKCAAKVVVKKVAECEGDNVRLLIALTESHIKQEWYGGTELNAVVRDIVTSTAGVKLTGDTQEITALFDVHNYKKENCELVAWIQNNGTTREVYQAVKISIAPEVAEYDLGISNIENVPTELCSGKIKPNFEIKNYGTQPLTSAVFNVTNDFGDKLGSYKWEGALANGAKTYFELPEINVGGAGTIKVDVVELNGDKEDKYTYDNKFYYEIATPQTILNDGILNFMVKTSEPENVSIDIINKSTGVTVKTITLSSASLKEAYTLPKHGCYRIVMKNSKGNGIGDINSFWGVLNSKKGEICNAEPGEKLFRYEYPIEIIFGSVGVEDVVEEEVVNVYPNPAKSVVNVYAENLNKVTVFNSIGQVVYTQMADSDNMIINVESWTNGLYYINLETENGVKSSQKVIVNK